MIGVKSFLHWEVNECADAGGVITVPPLSNPHSSRRETSENVCVFLLKLRTGEELGGFA